MKMMLLFSSVRYEEDADDEDVYEDFDEDADEDHASSHRLWIFRFSRRANERLQPPS